MLAVHLLMRMFAREALRVRERLLRFERELVELHDASLTQRRKGAKIGIFNHGWTRIRARRELTQIQLAIIRSICVKHRVPFSNPCPSVVKEKLSAPLHLCDFALRNFSINLPA
jgi:hypothetical protein